jgi:hypothetical protein
MTPYTSWLIAFDFLVGNGTFDTTLDSRGFPINGDCGNCFVKISTSGPLALSDYFTMYNTVAESDADLDLGSGGALLLPDLKDAAKNTKHLAVGPGKDAVIYVVDRDSMGKFNPATNHIYQEISGQLGGTTNGMVYRSFQRFAKYTAKVFAVVNAA